MSVAQVVDIDTVTITKVTQTVTELEHYSIKLKLDADILTFEIGLAFRLI